MAAAHWHFTCISLSNAFRLRGSRLADPQATEEVEAPHCLAFVEGAFLTAKHKEQINEVVKLDGAYCCVKLCETSTSVVCIPHAQGKVLNSKPSVVYSFRLTTEKQSQMHTRLALLCESTYGLPVAAMRRASWS